MPAPPGASWSAFESASEIMMSLSHLLRTVISLVLDYFRWTQLVPMILMWSLVVAGSFVLLFAYNEEAAWSIVDLGMRAVLALPFIGDRFEVWMESQTVDGVFSPDLGAVDWKALALKTWALISVVFMLTAAVLRRLVGPLPPFRLRYKLGLAAAASGLVVLGLVGLMYIDNQDWGSGLIPVLGSASLNGVGLFVVSAWCLAISHALGWLSQAVMDPEVVSIRAYPPH
jgi:hypothetical protein